MRLWVTLRISLNNLRIIHMGKQRNISGHVIHIFLTVHPQSRPQLLRIDFFLEDIDGIF